MERKQALHSTSFFTSQSFFLLIVVALLFIIATIGNGNFIKIGNLINILEQISVLGLVATGATILIISGNFDISVGGIIGLSCCVMAIMINAGISEWVSAVTGIVVCVICSSFNGFLSIVLKAPSFIISLATTGIFTGISLLITGGAIQTIYGKYDQLGSTKLLEFLPLVFILSLCGYVMVHYLLKHMQIGRRIFALGNNSRAAFLSGINVEFNKLLFFVLNGILIGIAANMLLSRLGGALPSTGNGIEMRAISAVVVGGVPITGGRGTILGTFLGVLLMGIISNMLILLQVNMYLQDILYGCIVLFAIALSSIRTRMGFNR